MAFPLKPLLKEPRVNKPYWVCDIESRDWTQFLIIGLYDGLYYSAHEGHKGLQEFFEEIIERMRDENYEDISIFAHFGGKFDFLFLLEEVVFNVANLFEVTSIMPRGSGLLSFDVTYTEKYKDKSKEPRIFKIRFNDSAALLPFGLKKLTESFQVVNVKGELDHSKTTVVTDEMREYLTTDCKGLYEVIAKFRNWPMVKRAGFKTTMASQSLQVFRTFMTGEIDSLSRSSDEFVRKSYFGGRTEIFKGNYESKSYGGKKLNLYDVNSLYPYVMRSFDYPTHSPVMTYTYMPEKQGFYEAEVFVPEMYVPPLPTVWTVGKSPKLIFPTGKFSGVWSTAELEYARSIGCKILKTGEGVVFENGGHIFKTYIDTLYKMRMDAKKKGDGVTDTLTKLLMNSLYGRFGLNADRESVILDDTGHTSCELWQSLSRGDSEETFELFKVPTRINTFSNVAIAAWVTSQSRILMHKYYVECGQNIWYTDTDSLFTTKKFKDSADLGGLKLEGEWDSGAFLLPKTYSVQSANEKKTVMKGMNKEQAQKEYGVKEMIDFMDGNLRVIKTTVDSRIATLSRSLNSTGHFLSKAAPMTKRIISKYDKRKIYKIDGQWDTRAWDIKNGVIR